MARVDPSARPRDYNWAAMQAVFAALFFCLGALLMAIGRGIETGYGNIGINLDSNYTDGLDSRFNEAHLHERWEHRREAAGCVIAGHVFAVIGWVFIIPPIACLAAIFNDALADSTLVYSFVCAGILTVVELVSELGTAQAADWIVSTWSVMMTPSDAPKRNAHGGITAAQSLELSYILIQSRTLWLYALDDLLLAFALAAAAMLTLRNKQVPDAFAGMALVLVILALIDFGFEVSRFVDWQLSENAIVVTTILLDMIGLPAWYVWLAFILKGLSNGGGAYQASVVERASVQTPPNDMEMNSTTMNSVDAVTVQSTTADEAANEANSKV